MTKAGEEYKGKRLSPGLVRFIIRWWAVGAVYFFIGWGTSMGRYDSIIDLVFTLGVIIGLAHSFILNPIFKQLYNWGWHRGYGESTFLSRFLSRLGDVFLHLLIVIVITLFYRLINQAAVNLMGWESERILLPGEPLSFGLIYALVCQPVMAGLIKLISRWEKRKQQ